MRDPSAAELLDAWETGAVAAPELAALGLLDRVDGGTTAALDLPIGERDRRLLELRQRLFGPSVRVAVTCGSCGERLELAFTIDDVRVPRNGDEVTATVGASLALDSGTLVTFRLPTMRDMIAARDSADLADARRRLVASCIVVAGDGGSADLSEDQIQAVDDAMAAADPQATVDLETTCATCRADVHAVFDIAVQLGAEIDAWARRTLHQVAMLASAYGWSEREILALSAWRRQYYLQAVGG